MMVPFLLTMTALGIAITHIFIYSVSNSFFLYTGSGILDMQATGQVGDFIGGVVGTIVGAISVLLLFKTLKVQIDFNQKQKKDLAIERFENKFYEMLKIHRDNVDQITINNLTGNSVSGRKVFSRLFNELRFIYYYCVNHVAKQKNINPAINLPDEKIYNIAYLIFFFGTGQVSNNLVRDILDNESITVFTHLIKSIQKDQELHRNDDTRKILKTPKPDGQEISFYYDYVPFQGHMGNLSHYVRHIFQLVRFVDEKWINQDDNKAKNEYIATMRSQLSIYEQALLYYNALSVLGMPWLEDKQSKMGLLRKYPLIKSLPTPLADFYRNPNEELTSQEENENGSVFFEWTEIRKRYQNIDSKETRS